MVLIRSQNGPWKMANHDHQSMAAWQCRVFGVGHRSHPSLIVNRGTTFLCSAQIPAKQIEFPNQWLLLDNQKPAQSCDAKHDVSMNALASGEYMPFFSTFSNKKYVDLQLLAPHDVVISWWEIQWRVIAVDHRHNLWMTFARMMMMMMMMMMMKKPVVLLKPWLLRNSGMNSHGHY